MRRIGLIASLLVAAVLVACANNSSDNAPQHSGESESVPVMIADVESGEASDVKIDVCEVESIQEDGFVLKNTEGETYLIDKSYLGELEEGDCVYLRYFHRTPLGEKEYSADVDTIHKSYVLRVEDLQIPS